MDLFGFCKSAHFSCEWSGIAKSFKKVVLGIFSRDGPKPKRLNSEKVHTWFQIQILQPSPSSDSFWKACPWFPLTHRKDTGLNLSVATEASGRSPLSPKLLQESNCRKRCVYLCLHILWFFGHPGSRGLNNIIIYVKGKGADSVEPAHSTNQTVLWTHFSQQWAQ